MSKELIAIDLFAGAGGFSEGFIRAGFKPVAHVEMDPAACFTLKTRAAYHWLKDNGQLKTYENYLKGNISRDELYSSVPGECVESVICSEIGDDTLPEIFKRIDSLLAGRKLDVIIGGPPCQAYSLVGRSRDTNRMKGDKRNYLYIYYAEFLKRYKPECFVFENVTGLLSAKAPNGVRYLDQMRELFKEVGYATEYEELTASDYGVPQHRKRVIMIGKRGKKGGFYPKLKKQDSVVKVWDVLKDLEPLQAGEGGARSCRRQRSPAYLRQIGVVGEKLPVTLHFARPHTDQDLAIYKIAIEKWDSSRERLNYNDLPERLKTHNNRGCFTDRFKVVAGNERASHTIVAHISKDGHYYIHPDKTQNRSLTPREAARLQTFPDDYYFESQSDKPGRTAPYRQIGNAVPVFMAEVVANALKENCYEQRN